MGMKDIINFINNIEIPSLHHLEDFIDTELDVVQDLDIEEHRWYTTATRVFKLEDGVLGVNGPRSLKNESLSYGDLSHACSAFEMQEINVISYKRKD